MHGGYWALAQREPQLCGVTVHFVDPGIDTGGVIGQALIHATSTDNFCSYPWLQLCLGLPILISAVSKVIDELPCEPVLGVRQNSSVRQPVGESRYERHGN